MDLDDKIDGYDSDPGYIDGSGYNNKYNFSRKQKNDNSLVRSPLERSYSPGKFDKFEKSPN